MQMTHEDITFLAIIKINIHKTNDLNFDQKNVFCC